MSLIIWYILCGIIVYLAIGGLLSGIFEDYYIDDFLWIISWPCCLIVMLVELISRPFTNFGSFIKDKVKDIHKKVNTK